MRRTVVSAVAAALVLAACGGGSDGAADPVPASEPAAEAPAEAPAAEATPGRTVALASGGTVDLDSFAGQDVLFWFWAPW